MFIKPTLCEGTSFFNSEKTTHDTIFNTRSTHLGVGEYVTTMNDKDFNKPDHEQYLFSTMGKGILAMYNNNMVTPVRIKNTLNVYGTYSELAKNLNSKNIENGIFIIDYFNIYNDGTADITPALEYYMDTNNIEFNDDIKNSIRELVNPANSKIHKGQYRIRIITYIPESSLNEHNYVYVPEADILLIKGIIDSTVVHPASKSYRDNNLKYHVPTKNIITIDIVNNDGCDPYYIKIGKDVHKLYPTKDILRPNSAIVTLHRNGAHIYTTKCKLHEMSGVFGIRDTYIEADTAGDISKQIELKKLENQQDTLRFEREKMTHEREMHNTKYQYELQTYKIKFETLELDMIKKYADYILAQKKAAFEFKTMVRKSEIEFNTLSEKHRLEMIKINTDFGVKTVSLLSTLFKLFK